MRKRGQYIIDKRCRFKEGKQREFLAEVKKISGLPWPKLSKKLNVSEQTLKWDLYTEKSTLPLCLLKIIMRKYPSKILEKIKDESIIRILEPKWGQKKAGEMNLKKIHNPRKDEKLAEFIGALIGDGHIEKKGIRIIGNILEIEHHMYLKRLIKELFNLEARVFPSYTNKSVVVLNVYSTNLVSYLSTMRLRPGNKMQNKTRIPGWIFEDKDFTYGALRGLFDTDGGIFSKQKGYKRVFIELENHCEETIKDIKRLIKNAGFKPSKSSINLRIQNQDEIHKFFRLVGSSNPKNIIRYKEFIKKGFIPLKEELNKKIEEYRGPQPFRMRP